MRCITDISLRPRMRFYWLTFTGLPVFAVTLDDGTVIAFQTLRARRWIHELNERIVARQPSAPQ